MRVWKDVISGDEMASDSYPYAECFEGAGLEVKARFVTKKANEDFGVAANTEEGEDESKPDDSTVTVVDVADGLRLQEITLDKKSFMAYIKGYLKAVKEHLEANGKADRVAAFQKGATSLVKELVGKWDEVQVFTGESGNWDAGLAYAYMKDQSDAGPTFFYFLDGLKQEKY
jgi:hypothetical protein